MLETTYLRDIIMDILNEVSRSLDGYVEELKHVITYLIWKALEILLYISRPLYILLLVIGVISYALPGSNTYKARKIIWGSILLMIFTEFIFPYVKDYIFTSI